MGALFGGRLDPAAMIRRIQILIEVRDAQSWRSVLAAVQVTEPTATYEYDNFPIVGPDGRPRQPYPLCKIFTCRVGSARLLFAGGVYDAQKGSDLWAGYTDARPPGLNFLSANPNFNEVLNEEAGKAYFYFGEGVADIQVWCGHSGGAALLFYLAIDNHSLSDDSSPQIIAFGSPAPVKNPAWHDYRWGAWTHIFCDDDPVPLIPPDVSYWQGLLAGLTGAQASRLQGWAGPPGGHELSFSGFISEKRYPSAIGATPPAAIGQWLDRQNKGLGTTHSLEAYLARALLYQLNNPAPVYSPDTPGVGTVGGGDYGEILDQVVASNAVVSRIREQAQASIISSSERNVTESTVVIPSEQAFKARRNGRIWYVTFRGVQICVAPNKKRALGFARVGNDFLRRMQIEGQVDPIALVSALKDYCLDAADPANGFIPPLRTSGF